MIIDMLNTKLIRFEYWINDERHQITCNSSFSNNHFEMVENFENEAGISRLKLIIKPLIELRIHSLSIAIKHIFNKEEMIFVNGYQSWTDSREYFIDEKMNSLSKLATPLLNKYQFDKYGDYSFKKYATRKGDFHGYTYGYIRLNKQFSFIGSLSEKNGFTIINTSAKQNTITIEKECKNLSINSAYEAFNLIVLEGNESFVFDTYFKTMKISKPQALPMTGWTSWYNYYQNINEELMLKNLNALKDKHKNIDIFQIDDGYQTFVGDWLDIDYAKFPRGMEYVAQNIHKKGYKAGIWLAPFVCETNSRIFRDHQDWILRDANNQFVLAGSNWSRFYALNLELSEVRNYIKHVFFTVLNDWGYDLVKLDFLYAVCLIPSKYKTRGQIMCEAMEFIRECVGDKLILGCGVPLGPTFGIVDYCRIGCDVGLDWDDKPFMRLLHRERVSTLNAIGNSISRRQLNGRAFINDPDVFFLREDNIKLTQTQKETVAFVNKIFGSLIFTSDDITKYSSAQNELFDTIMAIDSYKINEVIPYKNGLVEVNYTQDNNQFNAVINLSNREISGIIPYKTKISKILEVE